MGDLEWLGKHRRGKGDLEWLDKHRRGKVRETLND